MRNNHSLQNARTIITTSWDDGHPLDIRLAELLSKYGLKGTFYVPLKYNGHDVLDRGELAYLQKLGMEIGSHTVTHPNLTKISPEQVFTELRDSKKMLEDTLGEGIFAFCYPGGKSNQMVRAKVVEAGYALGRTTLGLRTDCDFDPFCMPATVQFYPHTRSTQVRHALREGNLRGLLNWALRWRLENNYEMLIKNIFDQVYDHGGILHIWGHSWEVDSSDLWDVMEEVFIYIANQPNVLYLTNSQILDFYADTFEKGSSHAHS